MQRSGTRVQTDRATRPTILAHQNPVVYFVASQNVSALRAMVAHWFVTAYYLVDPKRFWSVALSLFGALLSCSRRSSDSWGRCAPGSLHRLLSLILRLRHRHVFCWATQSSRLDTQRGQAHPILLPPSALMLSPTRVCRLSALRGHSCPLTRCSGSLLGNRPKWACRIPDVARCLLSSLKQA